MIYFRPLILIYLISTMARSEEIVIFDFEKDSAKTAWRVVNDGVMGGLSESDFQTSQGHGIFSGIVSLDNNGGFASVRSSIKPTEIEGCNNIFMRILGDGKRYKFTIRTNGNFDGVNYQQSFSTVKGEWKLIKLPLNKFTPTYHGRVLANKPELTAEKIASLGFMISDKQAGPFKLKIDWIQAGKKL